MHLHSTLYYYLDSPVIDDATFDKWAVELAELQAKHPEFKHEGYMPAIFEDWTGDTGFHLPVTEDILFKAQRHLDLDARKKDLTG